MNNIQYYHDESIDSSRILYTSAPFARKNLIYLQETGHLKAKAAHTSRRSYLNSFLFLIVESGSGVVTIQRRRYPMTAGDCAFIDCSNPYIHTTKDFPWSLRWVHLNGATMAEIYQKYLERSGSPVYRPDSSSPYRSIIDQLCDSAVSDSYVRDMEIHQHLSVLLTMIMKDCWNPEISRKDSSSGFDIHLLRSYLNEHYREKISLDDLSSIFFLSKYYLTRLFREQYGATISDYILDLRITRAKELLRFSELSLSEIAASCGFYDLPYFSRKFKNAEGLTPSAFRSQWK